MRRPMLSRRGTLVVAAALAVGLAAAGVAYWTAPGSGTASVSAGSPAELTLSAGTATGAVSPNSTGGVAAIASNPNPYEVHIGSLSLDTSHGTGGFEVDLGHSGCDVSALSFTTQSNGGAGWTVPPRVGPTDGSISIELVDALAMSGSASDACQGASFTLHLLAAP